MPPYCGMLPLAGSTDIRPTSPTLTMHWLRSRGSAPLYRKMFSGFLHSSATVCCRQTVTDLAMHRQGNHRLLEYFACHASSAVQLHAADTLRASLMTSCSMRAPVTINQIGACIVISNLTHSKEDSQQHKGNSVARHTAKWLVEAEVSCQLPHQTCQGPLLTIDC